MRLERYLGARFQEFLCQEIGNFFWENKKEFAGKEIELMILEVTLVTATAAVGNVAV